MLRGRPVKVVFAAVSMLGVVCDMREPDVLRLTPCPLYNSFLEVAPPLPSSAPVSCPGPARGRRCAEHEEQGSALLKAELRVRIASV